MFSTSIRSSQSLQRNRRSYKLVTLCLMGLMVVFALAVSDSSVKSSGVINMQTSSTQSMDEVPTVYATANAGEQQLSQPLLARALMPDTATISDTITLADPTFVRPSAAGAAGTPTSCPATGNPTVHYKLYEFNLAGCGGSSPVTINTCTASFDTVIYVYRKGDGSVSSPGSPTFFPTSPCTNVLVSNNNNSAACGSTGPSSVTTSMTDGNFVVVVAGANATTTGSFTLSVSSPTCTVTQIPSCNPTIDHTSDSFTAAGGTGSVNVAIGSTCAWTAASNDSWITVTSGASGTGNGTVGFSVDPNSGPARTGTMTVAGLTFTVTQEAGAVALPCIHDALVAGNPTFVRPSTSGAGVVSCPATGNPTTFYKAYEFDLSCAASVTASTCTNGPCPGPVTLTDTIVLIYRKSDGSASSPGSPIFNPTTPCANAVIGNNNSAACGVGSPLSSVTTSLAAGRFVVVVTSQNAGDVGTFKLNVTSNTPGCNVTLEEACTTINGTVTPSNQTVCPGSSATINVGVSGGSAPYTVSLDNGGGTQTGSGPFTFTVTPGSTTTYTASGTDADGCPITMSGTATVTVEDTTPPTVTCPADSSASADASCMAAVPDYAAAATTSDNCSGAVTTTQSPAAGTMVGVGPHTVTVTATDASGNTNTCTTTFTVNDTTAPTVSCPSGATASADASCQAAVPDFAAAATTSDNCPGAVTKTQSPAAGSMVGPGTHTVTVTATDASNNSSTCTTTFTVTDNTPPTVTCPANSSASADPGTCQAAIPDYASAASASDSCPGAVTKSQSPAAGTMVGLGPHTVTVTATDASGNSSTCTTTFTVTDNTPPAISCPSGTSASADASCQAAVPDYTAGTTATDSCPGAVTKTQSPAAGTLVGIGPHTVTVTATDASGNTNSCTTTFTVVDNTPPVVTCPAPSTASADPSTCTAPIPNVASGATATDNCSSSGSITKTQSPAAGTPVGLGTHTITVTATDQAGNSSTCTTTFTVTDSAGPALSFTTTTLSMWPPNHNYQTFTAASFGATAGDACGGTGSGIYIVSVTSDEVENGDGDGNTINDIVIAPDCKSVQLRAERQNNGDGRVYTIVFGVTDSNGNVTTGSVTVTVPKSQNGAGAVNSGPQYGETCP